MKAKDGPERVGAFYQAAVDRPSFGRLVTLLVAQEVLSRGAEDPDTAQARRDTLAEACASGAAVSSPLVAAALEDMPEGARDELLARMGAAAAMHVHAAAVRVVVGAGALRAEVEVTDGAADMVVIWATGMLPDEVAATLGELGEGAE